MSRDVDILFERRGRLGLVTLNRPKALNALSLDMVDRLDSRLADWAADDRVASVLIRGAGGKAFAAGGDIQRLHAAGTTPGDRYGETFFRHEYRLNRRIRRFPKPYVALIAGIAMGGGVGVSVHGSHRVAAEGTVFAMPETGIGFFPDVGGTFFLPRLPDRLGIWMALTGSRLNGADCLTVGLATHYVPADRHDALVEALSGANGRADVDAVLDRFAVHPGLAPIEDVQPLVERLFAGDSVPAIVAALVADGSEWAAKQLRAIGGKSPTALMVAFEQLRRGAALDFEAALVMEYRISQACMVGHDFIEGIRALIIDKDNRPDWCPSRIEAVDPVEVARHFEPPPGGDLTFD